MAKITNLNKDSLLQRILDEGVVKLILSKPNNSEFKKAVIKPYQVENSIKYQISTYTDTQVFHSNYSLAEISLKLIEIFGNEYLMLYAKTQLCEYNARITKKNKLLYNIKHIATIQNNIGTHNREKAYLLKEGVIVPALQDLGVMDMYGRIVKRYYDKFRQINRFLEIVDDIIGNEDNVNIVDFGCGKSYLTFVVYHYLTEIKKIQANIIGLDLKKDVIDNCNLLAQKYGYKNLQFINSNIESYKPTDKIDLIICLHACDTATDYALYNAIVWEVNKIIAVPCCQHEVNSMLNPKNLKALSDYGLIKERISSLITDTIRAKILEAVGYNVDILEFVSFEHTPKNIMIRAQKNKKEELSHTTIVEEINKINEEFNIKPCLYRLMKDKLEN